MRKDDVPADEAREERIHRPLFAAVEEALEEQDRLVQRDEARQVDRVLLGRPEDHPRARLVAKAESAPLARSIYCALGGAEEQGHDERVRKANLDAVDEGLSGQSERVLVDAHCERP